MMRAVAYILPMAAVGIAVLAMILITREPSNVMPYAPTPLTEDQKTWKTVRVRVPTLDVSLKVTKREHLAQYGRVYGVTLLNRTPCQIIVPEGWYIDAEPARGRAWFAEPDNASTLAHELLHCIAGNWHR